MNPKQMTDDQIVEELKEVHHVLRNNRHRETLLLSELLLRNSDKLDDGLWTPYGKVPKT